MAQFFRAADIANAAVEIERKGQAFYRRVADQATTPATRELFLHLMEEEKKHEILFAELLKRLGSVELPAWSTAEEYNLYVDALIGSHALFTGGLAERYMAQAGDEETAIRMAMAFEKDTLLFFLEMRDMVPDAEKAHVERCADEERLHLRQLSDLLRGKTKA